MKKRVLFLCTGNSCRSQMAEGFLNAYSAGEYEAYSAGTDPTALSPLAIDVMREVGIDISRQRSKSVTEYMGQHFPVVITVCDNAKEHCPVFPGPCSRKHWPFEDPARFTGTSEQQLAVFRKVRDQIAAHIRAFVAEKASA